MAKHAAPQPVDYTALIGALKQATTMPSNLPQVANAMAGQQVGANIAGIRAQQQQDVADAARRAQQLRAAGLAATHYLTGLNLPGLTLRDYRQSASNERAAAAGYSGGLQQTVGQEAAKVQANLNRIGAPGAPVNNSAAAGNALYGLGGNLPAASLDVVGPAVAASYRALPASTLAYGNAQAQGALGAGQAQAAKLDPSIVAAETQRATNAANTLAALQKDAEARGQHAFANILGIVKVQQADQAARDLANYRAAQIANNQASTQALADYRAAQLGISNYNAQTGRISATKPPASESGLVTVSPGSTVIDRATGKPVYTAPPKQGSQKPPLSPSQSASLAKQIHTWKTGVTGTSAGVPVVDASSQLSYSSALSRAFAQAPDTKQGRAQATRLVNAEYGTPQQIASQAARDAKAGGYGVTAAIRTILGQPDALPLNYYIAAFARAYGMKASDVRVIAGQLSQLIASGQINAG